MKGKQAAGMKKILLNQKLRQLAKHILQNQNQDNLRYNHLNFVPQTLQSNQDCLITNFDLSQHLCQIIYQLGLITNLD
jgi:NADH/NAD ratio-sensing transcriptional regulator Rex